MKLFSLLFFFVTVAIFPEVPDFSNLVFSPFEHNSNLNEYGPSLSEDGSTIYFYSKRNNSVYTDIFVSTKFQGNWSIPSEIPEFNSNYDDQSPHINSTEKFMMFSSNRDGSIEFLLPSGGKGVSRDLYVSFYKDGHWTSPYALPSQINTDFNEENPYYHNKLLFFTRYPFRRLDRAWIYLSREQSDGWSTALPLPEPVNDKYASISPSLSPDGKTLFFASNRPGGYGGFDIYMSRFSSKGFETPVNLGPKINSDKDESFFIMKRNTVVFCRKNEKSGYDLYLADFSEEDIVKELEKNNKITLRNIYFEHNSHELSKDSEEILKRIADYLVTSSKKIKIIGHTDLSGKPEYNLELSKKRAESVGEYFGKKGVDKKNIITEGKGETEPVSTRNEENRRTEFIIVN